MPGVFKNTAADGIVQLRVHQPLAEAHILLPRPRAHRLPRDAKLAAARHTDLIGKALSGEQLAVGTGVDVLRRGDVVFGRGVGVGARTNLDGASQDPGAAQIDVPLLLEVLGAEALEQLQGVVVRVVVVPLEALGVVEEDVGGEGVVAVDEVADVASLLVTALGWDKGVCGCRCVLVWWLGLLAVDAVRHVRRKGEE